MRLRWFRFLYIVTLLGILGYNFGEFAFLLGVLLSVDVELETKRRVR